VTAGRPPSRLAPLLPFLELVGLSGLVVASPIFQVFQDGAEVFVAYRASRLDIVLFALALVLVVPATLFAVELLAGLLGERWRRLAHAGAVALLLAALVLQVGKSETHLRRNALLALAVGLALVGAFAVWRWQAPRLFLRFLSIASAVFLVTFLFASPVSTLVVSSRGADAAEVAVGRPAPVLWIVLDELPEVSLLDGNDRIDAGLYPNLAALAGDGTWYRNSTTVAAHTSDAVPAMLTGRFPEEPDTLPVVAEHQDNLFTLLGGTYQIHASEGWADLCPDGMCTDVFYSRSAALPSLLTDARDVWHEKTKLTRRVRRFEDRNETFRKRQEQVQDFVDGLDQGDDRPRLDFLHVVLPHATFEFLPDGRTYEAPFPPGQFARKWVDGEVAGQARLRHLLQLQYTDRLLGDVLDRLRELGRYDESMIVVTADHGAAFTPGALFRGVMEENVHEIVWTPLVIKRPGERAGRVDDTAVRSIDLLPTVAEALDVDVPWELDGRAIGSGRGGGDLKVFRWVESELEPDDGNFITIDGGEGFERMLDAGPARRGDGDLDVYRLGAHGDLVGREVDDLPLADPVTVPGRVNRSAQLASVETNGDELPAYVSGETLVAGEDPVYAVAVNGVIGGWAHAYLPQLLPPGLDARYLERPRARWWGTMVPPQLLRDGRNRVELLQIEGVGPARALHPVRFGSAA
jgi:hypothetical protein